MQQNLELWTKFADSQTQSQIQAMSAAERASAFGQELKFGTAGLRGIMGIGSNRINLITITKAAYGYGQYILKTYGKGATIIIGTDNRLMHHELATRSAQVLATLGIKVLIQEIFPTPMVSFAIRYLKAQGGIIITASHNPAQYNGFKVYNHHGGQLLPSATAEIAQLAEAKAEYFSFQLNYDEALIAPLPATVAQSYAAKVLSLDQTQNKNLKIVFSPQHGTAAQYLPRYLTQLGYEVIPVEAQMSHDPHFSHTASPNPEDPAAYTLALSLAQKVQADLIITTDPDADRIGVAALKNGQYQIINGNELATIIFAHLVKTTTLPAQPFLVSSYVSSQLPALIAQKNHIKAINVATGFKWVAHVIEKYQAQNFVYGFEESYGSLIQADLARDKDSLQVAIKVAQIAATAKKHQHTLWDLLDQIYQEYGYFKGGTLTQVLQGPQPEKLSANFMQSLRQQDFSDLPTCEIIDLIHGKQKVAPMNLLHFKFASGNHIYVRPSGTEPKIKFYFMCGPCLKANLEQEYQNLKQIVIKIMEQHASN